MNKRILLPKNIYDVCLLFVLELRVRASRLFILRRTEEKNTESIWERTVWFGIIRFIFDCYYSIALSSLSLALKQTLILVSVRTMIFIKLNPKLDRLFELVIKCRHHSDIHTLKIDMLTCEQLKSLRDAFLPNDNIQSCEVFVFEYFFIFSCNWEKNMQNI